MPDRRPWHAVIDFWFGQEPDDAGVAKAKAPMWWGKDPEVDLAIRHSFETTVQQAAEGSLTGWESEPTGLLALVLLTDQFPRNMYRDTPRAFAFDALARAWTNKALESGFDARLRPMQRVFLYLPLEHSEDLADQQRSVVLFEGLGAESAPLQREAMSSCLDYARRHRDIIAHFGRFPHRNAVLGRPSTAEELEFLRQPGSRF
jgi:uncharacterized protein (DUF924 family)